MKPEKVVSPSVINRLPRYYRFLGSLLNRGVSRISSRELAHLMKSTASQIRQDLNCFGGFGQQGYGYNVEVLFNEIGSILGVGELKKTILMGVGNLGKALANQVEFQRCGFELIGAFDIDPQNIGKKLANGIVVQHGDTLQEFCETHKPTIAIICVPRNVAAQKADELISLGIKGFWNFSSYDFTYSYDNVAAVNVHLRDSLMTLSYFTTHLDQLPKSQNN